MVLGVGWGGGGGWGYLPTSFKCYHSCDDEEGRHLADELVHEAPERVADWKGKFQATLDIFTLYNGLGRGDNACVV